jgi:hypothetical protein
MDRSPEEKPGKGIDQLINALAAHKARKVSKNIRRIIEDGPPTGLFLVYWDALINEASFFDSRSGTLLVISGCPSSLEAADVAKEVIKRQEVEEKASLN